MPPSPPAPLKSVAILTLLTSPALMIFDSSVVSYYLWISVLLWFWLGRPVLPGFAIRLWWAAAWALSISCLFSLWWHGMNRQGLIEIGRYARVMLAYPFLCVLLAAKPHPLWLWAGASFCGVLSGIVGGIDTWWLHTWRSDALGFMHPVFFPAYASLAGAIAVFGSGYFAMRKQWFMAAFGVLGGIGALVAVASAGTRGTVLALILYALLGLGLLIRQRQWKWVGVMLVLFGLAVGIGLGIETPLQQRLIATMDRLNFSSINPNDALIGTRLFMWEAAWLAFLDNPLVGQGIGRYNDLLLAHAKLYENVPDHLLRHWHAHNDSLNLLAAQGLIGYLPWLVVMFAPLCLVRPALQAGQTAVAGSLLVVVAGCIAFGLVDVTFVHTHWGRGFAFYIGATMVLALGAARQT